MSESIYSVFGVSSTPANDEPLCPNCGDVGCDYCGAIDAENEYDDVFDDDYDDSMDGDFDSAMTSAGFGYDEQYDHYDEW